MPFGQAPVDVRPHAGARRLDEVSLGSRMTTQRIGTTGKPPCRHTAVSEAISMMRSPAPYQPGTTTACQSVSSAARVPARSALKNVAHSV